MKALIPWLVVLVYIVPIFGTLVSMRRRTRSLWSMGDSLRKLFPEDRYYRKIKLWEARYNAWKNRHPLAHYVNSDRLNLAAGTLEYAFGHLRDYTIGLWMMAAFIFELTLMIVGDPDLRSVRFPPLLYHGFFASLSLWTYRRHVTTGLKMTEFMRVNPHVHPEEFFEHYYRRLGPLTTAIPTKAQRTIDPHHVSYRTGTRPHVALWPILHGMYDTAIFARSAYKALETIGEEYGREVFDGMASFWGSRMLQLFRAELIAEGLEKFHSLHGKIILVFNHKSHLDFIFNFFALSATHLANGRGIRPRYMAAKDHFVDNKFVYSGLGIGQLIENVDMVFVDRKGKGKNSILQASEKLASKEIEIAMYPQGTRALSNRGPAGERLDAGYYTTGTAKSLKKDRGHLKKGCGYLAIDTATALREKNIPVHLVLIGIEGTATLIPKDSFKVQTEGTVKLTVGDVITLSSMDITGDITGLEEPSTREDWVEKIMKEVDEGLVKVLDLHEKLKNRFLDQVKQGHLVNRDHLLKLNHHLTQSDREGDFVPFMILDRIFALLSISERNLFLKELAQRLLNGEEILSLRDKVTDQLFRYRGKELKTIVRQEKAKAS